MSFVTDKQTLADLNLLGKYKEGSMFNLFNRVKTRGGELLMEEMFRSPLTNAAAINDRVARIKYLQQIRLQLDVNSELTEMATQYLAENRPSNYFFSIFQVCKEKMQEMMYSSEKYYLHQKNIQAIVEVLQAAGSLSEQLENKKLSHNPCSDMHERLEKIVNAESLRGLESKHPYTLKEMVQYHYLFLNKHRHELEELLQLIHQFDVFISVAYIAEQKKLNYAQASDKQNGELLKVENLRHPSLLNAKGNSITLATEENVLFLTGANMAGKSTWMKTLGVSFYLAHMGFPVAADKMRFSVMEGIFTSINVPDDISQGWSHFYAEVMRVKLVAKEVSSGKRLFVLFDELFKGTNVKDAYDATLVVTQKLAMYRSCAFVISTHIIEVGEELMGTPNIQFHYMPTVMKGAVPHYTYNLTPGITSDRQGMIIIENEKILEMLAG